MTAATGKSNTYHYCRCNTRTRKHLELCSSKMVPMEKLDRAVLTHWRTRPLPPPWVGVMLKELKRQEAELARRIAGYEHSPEALVDSIDHDELKVFAGLLRERLLNQDTAFTKEYLHLLVREIELKDNQATVRGSYRSLVGAIKFAAEKKKLNTP